MSVARCACAMPRRNLLPGIPVHAANRAAGGRTLFARELDYAAFEQVLSLALERVPILTPGVRVGLDHRSHPVSLIAHTRRLAGDDLADHPRVAAAARGELVDQRLRIVARGDDDQADPHV